MAATNALKEAIRSARTFAVLTHGGKLNLALFSPDASQVLTAGAGGAILWQLVPPKRLGQLATDEVLTGAEFTSNHGLATRSDSGRIRRWDYATGTLREIPADVIATKEASEDDLLVSSLRASSMRERKLSFSANGSWTAIWDERGMVRFSYLGRERARVAAPDVSRLIFSPSGNRFAIVEGETKLVVGKLSPDPSEVPRVSLLLEKAGKVQVITFSPDGTARVWEVATEKDAMILQSHRGAVTGAAFSSDGRWLVTAGADNTARV